MSYQKQQFGIMDECYFVPKSEILAWVNDLLKINITKIQALGSGAIYCQIFDAIHPGKLTLSKVNWKAKSDNQFLKNFTLLQSGFDKASIKRYIQVNISHKLTFQVQKLVKAKYQDNLQFIQWFKKYFDTNGGIKGDGYDAVQKRNKIVPDFSFADKIVVPKVFSGAGQIIPKDKIVSPQKKKEDIPPRLKSPRPNTTQTGDKIKTPLVTKKEQAKKQQVKKQEKKKPVEPVKRPSTSTHTPKPTQIKKVQTKPINPPPIKKTPIVGSGTTTAIKKPQQSLAQIKQKYQNQIKQLEQKISMVSQVIKSDQSNDMKIQLIREIVKVQGQKVQEKPSISNQKSAKKNHVVQKVEQKAAENSQKIEDNNSNLLQQDDTNIVSSQLKSQNHVEPSHETTEKQNHVEQTHHEQTHHEQTQNEQQSQQQAQQEQLTQQEPQLQEKPVAESSHITSQYDDDVI